MSFQRVLSWLLGFLVIRVEGESLEKFINMAASRGIFLWDMVRPDQHSLIARVRVSGLRPLRFIRRRVGCRVTVQEKSGLPFFFWRLRRRKLLTAGGIVFVLAIIALTSFVWFVEVTGTARISEAEVRRVLALEGVYQGAWKHRLDLDRAAKTLIYRIPGVAWAGVELHGTKVSVKIVEKVIPPQKPSQAPADVIAKREGLITQVLVLTGEAAVKTGDTVRPGQVVISGEITPPEGSDGVIPAPDGSDGKEGVPPLIPNRLVSARGIVRARTWRQGYGEAEIVEKGLRPSGAVVERTCIKWGNREIIIKGPKVIPFARSTRVESRKSLPSWRNLTLPVEVLNTVFHELVPYTRKNGIAGARQLAEEKARDRINREIPRGVKILKQRVDEVSTLGSNVIQIQLTVETLEDIGQVRYR